MPQPFNKEEVESSMGQASITELDLRNISGDKEAFDELLYIIHDKIDVNDGIKKLIFTNWTETVPEIESDALMLLAKETRNLSELQIQDMTAVGEEVRRSLAMMVIEIIKFAPSELS